MFSESGAPNQNKSAPKIGVAKPFFSGPKRATPISFAVKKKLGKQIFKEKPMGIVGGNAVRYNKPRSSFRLY
jgi:hypothetical protein